MTPLSGVRHAKVLVLRQLQTPGSSLGVADLKRRLPGLEVEQIKQALRELVAEKMVEVAFRSTDSGKRFYVPPK